MSSQTFNTVSDRTVASSGTEDFTVTSLLSRINKNRAGLPALQSETLSYLIFAPMALASSSFPAPSTVPRFSQSRYLDRML